MSQEYDIDATSDSPLDVCARMRMPRFEPDTPARERVAKLEDYLYESAIIEGEISELRLGAQRSLEVDERTWDAIKGWEANLRQPTKTPTKADADAAKAAMAPELGLRIRQARWTISRCNEALERLDRETKRISRALSFINGL